MSLKMAGVAEDNQIMVRFNDRIHQILQFVDERLGSVPFLAGDEFTGTF